MAKTKISAPPITRLAHPLAFVAFLRHIGAPVERHLRRQRLPTLCDDPNVYVPVNRAWAFFDAAAQSEDLMLGWHVGQFVGDHNLNHTLLRKLEGAPTLYLALQELVRMVSSESSHLQMGIRERGQDILFCTQYSNGRDQPGYVSSQAYQLGAYLNLIRHFLGKHWVPPEIGFEYPTSSPVIDSYFPGSRIRPGQGMLYLAIPRSCLHVSVRKTNRGCVSEDGLIFTKKLDFVDTLRLLLRSYMADGYVSEQFAASLMDTSVRTLTRRLSEHDLTYRSLLDEVRFKAAKEMLQSPEAKIIDVAVSTGFEDHSHFTRMFRRIGGILPSEYRKSL